MSLPPLAPCTPSFLPSLFLSPGPPKKYHLSAPNGLTDRPEYPSKVDASEGISDVFQPLIYVHTYKYMWRGALQSARNTNKLA